MKDNLTHAYVGKRPCGHAMYLAVDDGSKDLGIEIARLIKDGNTIERVTIEVARKTPIYCQCEQPDDYVEKQKSALRRDKRRRNQ